MNRGELKKYTRFLLDQFGSSWLADDDASAFDLNEALLDGYRRYASETECFKVSYTLSAVEGEGVYPFSSFGTLSSGGRITRATAVGYSDKLLRKVSTSFLDGLFPDWRWAASGVPLYWVPWGERTFRLYPKPSATSLIYLEGPETPDPSGFASDSDVPEINEDDHRLLAIWAAMLIVTRGAVSDMAARTPTLFESWKAGIEGAKERIAASGNLSGMVGLMGSVMTLLDLKKLTISLITEAGGEGFSIFDVTEAVRGAYRTYCQELRIFREGFTKAAIIDQALYSFSDFGSSGEGARIYELLGSSYDSSPLSLVDISYLDGLDPQWREAVSGTPEFIVPWGKRKIRLHPKPSGTSTIYVEGFIHPDMTAFATDDDVPDMNEDDHPLLAVYAAATVLERFGTPESAERLKARWQEGLAKRKSNG